MQEIKAPIGVSRTSRDWEWRPQKHEAALACEPRAARIYIRSFLWQLRTKRIENSAYQFGFQNVPFFREPSFNAAAGCRANPSELNDLSMDSDR
jgi:hypothetical protein